MTLLERFDTWGEVGCDPNEIRRALAESQALREAPPSETWQIMRRADELLMRRAYELLRGEK